MERLRIFLYQFGVWSWPVGGVSFLLALDYTDEWTGLLFLLAGAALLLLEPLVFAISYFRTGQKIERSMLVAWALFGLTLIFYFIRESLDVTLDKVTAGGVVPLALKLQNYLLAIFVITFFAALALRLALSLGFSTHHSRTRSLSKVKGERIARAVLSSVIALLLLIIFNYIVNFRNPVWDLSPGYFSFGDSARIALKKFDTKITAYVFLPSQQAVRYRGGTYRNPELYNIAEDVRNYMEQLPLINSNITVRFLNADVESTELMDFMPVSNGSIVFRIPRPIITSIDEKPFIERRIYVSNEKDLNNLEINIIKSIIHLSSRPRRIYFTASHGERYDFTRPSVLDDGLEKFKDELEFYNYDHKPLDFNVGWPGPIPEDATAVLVMGPTKRWDKVARESLKSYLRRGGKVLISFDPRGQEDFSWLFPELGVKQYRFNPEMLSFKIPAVVVTDQLEMHDLSENIRESTDRVIIMPQSGHFVTVIPEPPSPGQPEIKFIANYRVTELIKTPYNTIVDENLNGELDDGEKDGRFIQALVYEEYEIPTPKQAQANKAGNSKKPRSKLVMFSGVSWLINRALDAPVFNRKHNNLLLGIDTLHWLTETPILTTVKPKERLARSVQVSSKLKYRNMVLGIFLFPVIMTLLALGGTYLYRSRRRYSGEE